MKIGLHNGYDLITRAGFLKTVDVLILRKTRPKNVHLSPPCFPWTQFQNLNQPTPAECAELGQKREHSRKMLKNLQKLAEIQIKEMEGELSGKHSWTAVSWK